MTAATLATPAHATTTTNRYRVSFPGVLKSEFTKLFSLRSTYWLFGLTFVGYVALIALLAAVASFDGSPANGRDGAMVFLLAIYPAQLIAVAIGAIVVTGEYSTGAIHASLSAAPKRWPVLVAKSLVVAVSVGVITTVSMAASVLVGKALLPEYDLHIMTGDFWLSMAGGLFYLVGIALISVALGFLIRSTAGAICAGMGVVMILPMVFSQILGNYTWAVEINTYLPASLQNPLIASPLTSAGPGMDLSALAAAGVMAAWVVVLTVAAGIRLAKTDA